MNMSGGGTAPILLSRYLLGFAVLVHAVAWVAPVQGDMRGYGAFAATFGMIASAVKEQKVEGLQFVAMFTPHTNYLMVAAIWLVLSRRIGQLKTMSMLLMAAFVCNMVWLVPTPKDLLAGYYLWLFSFPLMAGACGLARQEGVGVKGDRCS